MRSLPANALIWRKFVGRPSRNSRLSRRARVFASVKSGPIPDRSHSASQNASKSKLTTSTAPYRRMASTQLDTYRQNVADGLHRRPKSVKRRPRISRSGDGTRGVAEEPPNDFFKHARFHGDSGEGPQKRMGRPLKLLRVDQVTRCRLGRREYPNAPHPTKRLQDLMMELGNRQVEWPSVLGLGKMDPVFVDLLPAQRQGFGLAQSSEEQQPVVGLMDRVCDPINRPAPLRQVNERKAACATEQFTAVRDVA